MEQILLPSTQNLLMEVIPCPSINIDLIIILLLLGNEVSLKLRLSSTLSDVKLSVYSKDSIGQCKKKLQVRILFNYLNV